MTRLFIEHMKTSISILYEFQRILSTNGKWLYNVNKKPMKANNTKKDDDKNV